jgi:hypothetical protein
MSDGLVALFDVSVSLIDKSKYEICALYELVVVSMLLKHSAPIELKIASRIHLNGLVPH